MNRISRAIFGSGLDSTRCVSYESFNSMIGGRIGSLQASHGTHCQNQVTIDRLKTRVSIREPTPADSATFLAAVRKSRGLHRGWVTPPATPQAFFSYLERIALSDHRGFLIIHKSTKDLVGVINVSHIIHGNFGSAFLGYYAFSDYAGEGLMQEGMRLVLHHVFRRLYLHRVEANIQPQNKASRSLVRACGFVCEGYSRRYLKIAGRWKDHERWAILAEDFGSAASPRRRPQTLSSKATIA